MKTLEQRFWGKVDKSGECWIWKAASDSHGYGQMWVDVERGRMPAHRISWELANGPIPHSIFVDHMCFTRACVNPSHLRLATNKQNHENRPGPQRNSTSGVRGVSWSKPCRKWRARVKHNGVEHHLGVFETLEEADAAAVAKRNELYTHNLVDRRMA